MFWTIAYHNMFSLQLFVHYDVEDGPHNGILSPSGLRIFLAMYSSQW